MEDYFAAKASLFERLNPDGRAAISIDSPWGQRLAALHPRAITFGERGAVRFLELRLDTSGIAARVATPRGEVAIRSRLVGTYNAQNVLAAVAAAEALELAPEVYAPALAGADRLPGRMDPVDRGQPYPVVIDYAHTDGALRAALEAMRGLAPAAPPGRSEGGGDAPRLIVVFGCGGDRDRGKRPLMGRAAGELADYAILTTDNPRTEDPMTILRAVEEGIASVPGARWEVVPDRRQAIRRAIALAGPRSSVLIAGKGHERMQLVGDRRLPFVDHDEAAKAIEDLVGPDRDE
jgi:UDP-N-acetylmuramoyl-L-alanyl-D-glutamate--2,6-diaminopimelate ligase